MRRPSPNAVAHCVAALLLTSGLAGTAIAAGSDEPMGPFTPAPDGPPTTALRAGTTPTATTATPAPELTATAAATAEAARDAAPATSQAATQENLDTTPDPWALGDDIAARVDSRWSDARGVYLNERGFPDTRLNALLLNLHAMAALAGHQGASRQDARITPMVRVLTSPPVRRRRATSSRAPPATSRMRRRGHR